MQTGVAVLTAGQLFFEHLILFTESSYGVLKMTDVVNGLLEDSRLLQL